MRLIIPWQENILSPWTTRHHCLWPRPCAPNRPPTRKPCGKLSPRASPRSMPGTRSLMRTSGAGCAPGAEKMSFLHRNAGSLLARSYRRPPTHQSLYRATRPDRRVTRRAPPGGRMRSAGNIRGPRKTGSRARHPRTRRPAARHRISRHTASRTDNPDLAWCAVAAVALSRRREAEARATGLL